MMNNYKDNIEINSKERTHIIDNSDMSSFYFQIGSNYDENIQKRINQ